MGIKIPGHNGGSPCIHLTNCQMIVSSYHCKTVSNVSCLYHTYTYDPIDPVERLERCSSTRDIHLNSLLSILWMLKVSLSE